MWWIPPHYSYNKPYTSNRYKDVIRTCILVVNIRYYYKSHLYFHSFYSPLPDRLRLSLRTINLIQSGMLVRKCISGEKSVIVLSNHNYGGR